MGPSGRRWRQPRREPSHGRFDSFDGARGLMSTVSIMASKKRSMTKVDRAAREPRKPTAGSRTGKGLAKSPASMPAEAKPQTGREARTALVKALFGSDDRALSSFALDLMGLEENWPEDFASAMKRLASIGATLGEVLQAGGPHGRHISRAVLAYRRRIIAELEISTTAEFMLLDAAMDAYAHWLEMSALAWESFKDGWADTTLRHQARLAGMAQSYLRTFMDAMKSLMDVKYPPIRVLQVQAGQTVAVQVNEGTARVLKGKQPERPQNAERRDLLESAPADAEATLPDHG